MKEHFHSCEIIFLVLLIRASILLIARHNLKALQSHFFFWDFTDETHILGLFVTESILLLVTLYMSFCYGLLFLFIEGYPVAFGEVRS